MTKWYYKINEVENGPFDEVQMKEFIRSGTIKPDTMVGASEWIKLSDSEFKSVAVEPSEPFGLKIANFSQKWGCGSVAILPLLLILFATVSIEIGLVVIFLAGLVGVISGVIAIPFILIKKSQGISKAIWGILISGLILFFIISLLPAMGCGSRAKAKIRACSNNLKQLSLAFKNYAVDNEGYFPPEDGAEGLEYLRRNDYVTDCKLFICPNTDIIASEQGEILLEENLSYVYKGGLKDIPENANIPVAWDKDGNHKDYGNILYGDGRVETVKGADWKDKLKAVEKKDNK